jgi:glycosyltransferase involved in cell wall biosynthesis
MREFTAHGHDVYIASACERRAGKDTHLIQQGGVHLLRVKIGNIQKTGIIEKGISTITLERNFFSAIKKFFKTVKFDLIIYSTPPITFYRVVNYIKKRDNCVAYLLLKDIFPQNAVDIGMMNPKGLIYRYFRRKEIQLYEISDFIGCMSPANVRYLMEHNPQINSEIVHVNPNSIEPSTYDMANNTRAEIRTKYGIPENSKVFIYGGNLGKPQNISFIIKCIEAQIGISGRDFIICGTGTEYPKLEQFVIAEKPNNIRLINGLSKKDYDLLVRACDVGMIFLDERFTIPNFPSRVLSYMDASIPVFACTDKSTDMGGIIHEGGFGWWCESNDVNCFAKTIDEICAETDLYNFGKRANDYLIRNYTARKSYDIIIKSIEGCKRRENAER